MAITEITTEVLVTSANGEALLWLETDADGNATLNDERGSVPFDPATESVALARAQWVRDTGESPCPAEWEGRARRVDVEYEADGGFLRYGAWELTEDIEGHMSAGQLWLDGDNEDTEPAGDWVIDRN